MASREDSNEEMNQTGPRLGLLWHIVGFRLDTGIHALLVVYERPIRLETSIRAFERGVLYIVALLGECLLFVPSPIDIFSSVVVTAARRFDLCNGAMRPIETKCARYKPCSREITESLARRVALRRPCELGWILRCDLDPSDVYPSSQTHSTTSATGTTAMVARAFLFCSKTIQLPATHLALIVDEYRVIGVRDCRDLKLLVIVRERLPCGSRVVYGTDKKSVVVGKCGRRLIQPDVEGTARETDVIELF